MAQLSREITSDYLTFALTTLRDRVLRLRVLCAGEEGLEAARGSAGGGVDGRDSSLVSTMSMTRFSVCFTGLAVPA